MSESQLKKFTLPIKVIALMRGQIDQGAEPRETVAEFLDMSRRFADCEKTSGVLDFLENEFSTMRFQNSDKYLGARSVIEILTELKVLQHIDENGLLSLLSPNVPTENQQEH